MNNYYKIALELQDIVTEIIGVIFGSKKNELEIKVEDLNVLQRNNNSINSSTAIGYLIEEYVIVKLLNYFNSQQNKKEIKMNVKKVSNQNSYDFAIVYKNHLFYINLKTYQKNNNAIAAIKKLYDDYVEYNGVFPLHFLIFKINYNIGLSSDNENIKIIINSTESYFLEEINFSEWHQDKRSWSEAVDFNSGRLQVSNKFLKEHLLEIDNISYEKTKEQLALIYKLNRNKEAK
ncbi:UpaP162 family type II restriction enzyme [Mycoplasma capricolum]|uniref:UpaP162 family type II restriction enzyme n=1 Tax=Mycoplasma capricolum TaxID=2095 RepID=UPI0022F3B2FD|nr:hypothetical protein [Mycoplasma capricolum]WBX36446.1 hypothetical protein NO343_01120 [Mycoplasma capricolum subsp. capricolum]